MSLCPKCEKDSNCSCSNCKDRADPHRLMEKLVDPGIGIFQCPYCDYIYHYGESEDLEWKRYKEKQENDTQIRET